LAFEPLVPSIFVTVPPQAGVPIAAPIIVDASAILHALGCRISTITAMMNLRKFERLITLLLDTDDLSRRRDQQKIGPRYLEFTRERC
jgi:hypothetical protein